MSSRRSSARVRKKVEARQAAQKSGVRLCRFPRTSLRERRWEASLRANPERRASNRRARACELSHQFGAGLEAARYRTLRQIFALPTFCRLRFAVHHNSSDRPVVSNYLAHQAAIRGEAIDVATSN